MRCFFFLKLPCTSKKKLSTCIYLRQRPHVQHQTKAPSDRGSTEIDLRGFQGNCWKSQRFRYKVFENIGSSMSHVNSQIVELVVGSPEGPFSSILGQGDILILLTEHRVPTASSLEQQLLVQQECSKLWDRKPNLDQCDARSYASSQEQIMHVKIDGTTNKTKIQCQKILHEIEGYLVLWWVCRHMKILKRTKPQRLLSICPHTHA